MRRPNRVSHFSYRERTKAIASVRLLFRLYKATLVPIEPFPVSRNCPEYSDAPII